MGDTVASPSKAPSSQPGVERAVPERGDIDGEVALRESEAHYRVPWTAGPGGELLDISTRWSELTGLARDQILRGEGREAIHPEDRHGAILARRHARLGRLAGDLGFDRVELADPLQRRLGDRRPGRHEHIVELASCMRPTGRVDQPRRPAPGSEAGWPWPTSMSAPVTPRQTESSRPN